MPRYVNLPPLTGVLDAQETVPPVVVEEALVAVVVATAVDVVGDFEEVVVGLRVVVVLLPDVAAAGRH